MSNRLKLDWTLSTSEERANFINEYIQSPQFIKKALTEEETNQCAEYMLWGLDKDGKNGVQKKDYQIQTKKKTWNKKEDESLDALLETPAFNEALILNPQQAQIKFSKEDFSREKALKQAPEDIKKILVQLFRDIDELDLVLNYYDLAHEKRKSPPRAELLEKFTELEKEHCKEIADNLKQYQYLKKRHELVELRRAQFSFKDMYTSTIQVEDINKEPVVYNKLVFDADMNVYPFGTINQNNRIFKDFNELVPTNFSEEKIQLIIQSYWRKQKERTKFYFDFENPEHVYELILNYIEFYNESMIEEVEDTLRGLLKTLEYYIEKADLTECQKEILQLKIQKKKNQEIMDYINEKYSKSYTANYISTIFRQKIVKKITDCVTYHKEVILNLPFEEEFKRCSNCGTLLLKHSHNFVKKTRAKDGFTNRCKECDKKDR